MVVSLMHDTWSRHGAVPVRDHLFTNAVVQERAEPETLSRFFMLSSYLNRIWFNPDPAIPTQPIIAATMTPGSSHRLTVEPASPIESVISYHNSFATKGVSFLPALVGKQGFINTCRY